ncbi:unnamed protein product [Periconia digitata]|uniref:Uncharacterized protein n=1 Tax=Periconia digitata TaxID=1303443 RepID=A0A9W4USH2_9PLEO|nr:unnamed protein product [Periconia digitata]
MYTCTVQSTYTEHKHPASAEEHENTRSRENENPSIPITNQPAQVTPPYIHPFMHIPLTHPARIPHPS